MAVPTIREQVEALPHTERMGVKLRAKAVKDGVLDRVPGLCCAPFGNLLHEICVACAFDDYRNCNTHDGETLRMVRDVLDGMADREDVRALQTDEEDEVVACRTIEEGLRTLSRTVDSMIDDDFSLCAAAFPVAAPTPPC